jgi:SAM-dependent methyltransferase
MRFTETVQDLLKGSSLTRSAFNRALASITKLSGRILDVGGKRIPLSSYYRYLAIQDVRLVDVLNITDDVGADIVADATAIPCADASYDAALCFNVLEHVARPQQVLAEIHRVLKPGGRFIFMVPFLHKVHGDPDDYFRYTESGLRVLFTDAGFTIKSVQILGLGPFTGSLAQWQTLVPGWVAVPFFALSFAADKLYAWQRPQLAKLWPLGYLVEATAR